MEAALPTRRPDWLGPRVGLTVRVRPETRSGLHAVAEELDIPICKLVEGLVAGFAKSYQENNNLDAKA